jgi:hypothetical protein
MEQTHKTSPKDVFLHLLAIIALYISAGTFISLIFNYINILYPDALDYYSVSSVYDSIRFSIATLIVTLPVYVLTTRFLNRSYVAEPSLRNLRIRKWLVYFTLFLTALIMMGDLVYLIYQLLNGDITLRFILKVITVLFVAGSIFWYYYMDLKVHKID